MKLIVGLGNPGAKYARTRHNAGWLALDHCLDSLGRHPEPALPAGRLDAGSGFKPSSKFHADTAEVTSINQKIIFAKPTTFMNRSGGSVAALSSFYKIQPADILVIHDELDLPFGSLRLRRGGGDAGHKGIVSIAGVIGGNFLRLRLGISNEFRVKQAGEDFVLSNFMPNEAKQLDAIFSISDDLITQFINNDLKPATYTIDQ